MQVAGLRAALSVFERRYLEVVGVRYAKLDDIEAQIAEQLARKSPSDLIPTKVLPGIAGELRYGSWGGVRKLRRHSTARLKALANINKVDQKRRASGKGES